MSKNSDCFICLRTGHVLKDRKSRTSTVLNCGRQLNRLFQCNFSNNETKKIVSDATKVVANEITQGGLPVVRITGKQRFNSKFTSKW